MRWKPQLPPFLPGLRNRPLLDRWGRLYWAVAPTNAEPPPLLRLVRHDVAVGYIEMDWRLPDAIENFGILVEPLYRRQGLGKLLIRAMVATARRYRVAFIEGYVRQSDLVTQPHLLHWYARQGFRVINGDSVVTAARLVMRL